MPRNAYTVYYRLGFSKKTVFSVDFICGNSYKMKVSLKGGFWKMLFSRDYGSESSGPQLKQHLEALIQAPFGNLCNEGKVSPLVASCLSVEW